MSRSKQTRNEKPLEATDCIKPASFSIDAPEFKPTGMVSNTKATCTLNAEAPEFIPGQLPEELKNQIEYMHLTTPNQLERHMQEGTRSQNAQINEHQAFVPIWVPQIGNFNQPRVPVGYEQPIPYPYGPAVVPDQNNGHFMEATSLGHMQPHIAEQGHIHTVIAPPPTPKQETEQPLTWAERTKMARPKMQQQIPIINKVQQQPVKNAITPKAAPAQSIIVEPENTNDSVNANESSWNGRVSFAEIMKRNAEASKREQQQQLLQAKERSAAPPQIQPSPQAKKRPEVKPKRKKDGKGPGETPSHVNTPTAASTVSVAQLHPSTTPEEPVAPIEHDEAAEEDVNNQDLVVENASVPNQDGNISDSELEGIIIPTDSSYSVDVLLKLGMSLYKNAVIEQMRRDGAPCFKFVQKSMRNEQQHHHHHGNAGGATNNSAGHHNKGQGNNAKRDNTWRNQRRQGSNEYTSGKAFGNNYKDCDNLDFSRDNFEAVSIPKASESSWIIKQRLQKEDRDQLLIRKIVGLLNRLTFEKFDTIYDQIIECGLTTVEHALMVVRIVFEKAITQHHFIPMYVELCVKLSVDLCDIGGGETSMIDIMSTDPSNEISPPQISEKAPATDKTGKRSDFMRILLNCSQDSFENNLKPLTIPEELQGDDRFEYEQKYKHKLRGNMMFVGELFKQRLLAGKLLIACLDQLFQKRAECLEATKDISMGDNYLEAMCTLLLTVGRCFDHSRWKHLKDFEQRIQLLADLGQNEDICFRIRCLIQNVLDSRLDNWDKTSVHKTEAPCKLQELRNKATEQQNAKYHEEPWRNGRRRPKPAEPAATPTPKPKLLQPEQIASQSKSIISELILSHDPAEASLRIEELKIPTEQEEDMLKKLLHYCIEACAKTNMENEQNVVVKWIVQLAQSRNSQEMLIVVFKEFLTDEECEGYHALCEDYPVLPQLLQVFLRYMQPIYGDAPGFNAIRALI
ncbi:bifunctional Armadillo-type fold/MIF4G-like [Babesia duncani]|uniref:Bifunctional Armadillo-type fold/MIF4G-like n=2 Tax=Babesia TaxID=5864 RepID=A0AAD9PNM3_9APIC|nr:unknown [Babesia sp. WA1]KAK2198215.1 bifunctional Armadillo-type fold/MIF4G-like [Babesia duncani]